MKPIETNIHESHSVENWKRLKLTAEFLIKIRFRIFTFAIVGFAMGFILTKQSREEYSATLTFSLESQNSPQGLAGIANQFGISLGSGSSGTFTGDNLLLLLTSRRLIEEVLMSKVSREKDTVLLANLYVKSDPDLYQNWVNKNLYPFHLNTAINLKQDSALTELWEEIIDKRLVIKRKNLESNIVFIKVSSHDPTFSKEFAVVLGNRATEFYLESKNRKKYHKINHIITHINDIFFFGYFVI